MSARNLPAIDLVDRSLRLKSFEARTGIAPTANHFATAMTGTEDELDQLESACEKALAEYRAAKAPAT